MKDSLLFNKEAINIFRLRSMFNMTNDTSHLAEIDRIAGSYNNQSPPVLYQCVIYILRYEALLDARTKGIDISPFLKKSPLMIDVSFIICQWTISEY